MSQMPVVTAKVVAEAPLLGQGDMEASPKPDPSANSISETEAATNAPPMIAGHDTAEVGASLVWTSPA